MLFVFFFFNDTATTEIYTLSLHDALPILGFVAILFVSLFDLPVMDERTDALVEHVVWTVAPLSLPISAGIAILRDRKSTRLNSSHANISYAVFCLKKKNKNTHTHTLYIQQ